MTTFAMGLTVPGSPATPETSHPVVAQRSPLVRVTASSAAVA